MKLNLIIILSLISSCLLAQTPDSNYVLIEGGYITGLYKPFTGTRAQLDANNNTFYLSAQTSDYGTDNWTKISNTSFGYTDNGITVVIDAAGQVWKVNGPENEVKVERFLPAIALSDTADKTTYLQAAINFSKDKTLKINPSYRYVSRALYGSDNTIVEGNDAVFEPHWSLRADESAIFLFATTKIGYDGKYTGGGNVFGQKTRRKILNGFTIKNIKFYSKNYRVSSLEFTSEFDRWVEIGNVRAINCETYNAAKSSYNIINRAYVSDSAAIVRNVDIATSKSFYNGQNIALYARDSALIGDTVLYLKTADGTNISLLTGVGKYVQFGTAGNNSTLTSSGYGGTNKIYRIKTVTLQSDSTVARIVIIPGSYSPTAGFIDSVGLGFTAPVVKYTMTIPVDAFMYPMLMTAPFFTGTAGTNTVTRSTISSNEDAYYKNLMVGMQVSFVNQPGVFTITNIVGTTMTLDRNLLSSFATQRALIAGVTAPAVSILGYIQNGNVDKCYFYANSHSLYLAGCGGKGLFAEDIINNISMTNSKSFYSWMASESTSGTEVKLNGLSKAGFINGTALKGDSLLTVATPANYRTSSKDIDGDGIADKFITNVGTTDGNVTWLNALFVGEIIMDYQWYYRYKIVDIYVDGANIIVKCRRWNQNIRNTVPGGFEANLLTAWASNTFERVYSLYAGEIGQNVRLTYFNNEFHPNYRVQGGGYAASVRAKDLVINKNKFYGNEASILETSGYQATITDNDFSGGIFTGEKVVQGVFTFRNETITGKGVGGIGTFASYKTIFENNRTDFRQPKSTSDEHYSHLAGGIGITTSESSVYSPELLSFTNNNFKGIRTSLITAAYVDLIVSGPTSYAANAMRYDLVNITGNTFTLYDNNLNSGLFGQLASNNTTIKTNTVISSTLTDPFKIFRTSYLNPRFYDTTLMHNIVLEGNTYPTAQVLNVLMGQNKIDWRDLYYNTRHADGMMIMEGGREKTIPIPSGGGGSGKIKNDNF